MLIKISSNVGTDFNSIKVRLKPFRTWLFSCLPGYFNSIKVRLKRDEPNLTGKTSLFQFHKGTIKTIDQLIKGCPKQISIP